MLNNSHRVDWFVVLIIVLSFLSSVNCQSFSSSSSSGRAVFSSSSSSSSSPLNNYRVESITGCQFGTSNYLVSGCYEGSRISLSTPLNSPAPLSGLCLQSNSSTSRCYPLTCTFSSTTSQQRWYYCLIPPIDVGDQGLGLNVVDNTTNTRVVANTLRMDIQSLGRAPLRITSVFGCWDQDNYDSTYTSQCYTGKKVSAILFFINPTLQYSYQLLSTISSRVYELSATLNNRVDQVDFNIPVLIVGISINHYIYVYQN